MRYFFDLRDRTGFTPDDDGLEFGSTAEAVLEGTRAAAQMTEDLLAKDGGTFTIEVRDATGCVAAITTSMTIVLRHNP